MELESFSGIFRDSLNLKGNLTSCEQELRELMRQIDLMVTAKKAEWENHLHAVQIQLDKRNKEVGFMRTQLDEKNLEVDEYQRKVEDMELSQRDVIAQYEEQVIRLKGEVDNLKVEHEKLQKKTGKQAMQVEKERDQLLADLKAKETELQRSRERVEEYKEKMMDWDGARRAWEERVRGLENQKKSLIEKHDLTQQQLLGYQTQLSKRRQMLEASERDRIREIEDLDAQLKRVRDESESKEGMIDELRKSLDKALSEGREQANETAQLQEDLRMAVSAIQQLEAERDQLQVELQARDDLILAAEQDQQKHADDVMKLEQSLTMKDEIIKKFESASMRAESMDARRMKEDLRTSRIESQSLKETEKYLREELDYAKQKLESTQKTNSKLQSELKKKVDEIRAIEEGDIKRLTEDKQKLEERLYAMEQGRVGELEGMRGEVQNLTSELHRRDTSVANVSEKLQRMERELRETNTRYDRCAAELQVTNAQLEALRLENRHLRDAAASDQLNISDVYKGNMDLIAQMEGENRDLRMEVASLREQLTALEVSQQEKIRDAIRKSQNVLDGIKENEFKRHSEMKTDADRKIAALESRLEATIRKYETQMHYLQNENESLKNIQRASLNTGVKYSGLPEGTKVLPEYTPRRPVNTSRTSASDYTDTEALTYADLTAPQAHSDGEKPMGTPQFGSRRTSLTADFMAEEGRRERELERILDDRIADLRASTDYIISKYT
ncbi:centrosomal protein of 63 kDa isoform X2 [Nematostella vectensis]|uniref:centrosomal protein of 63 kDa isoform X2 n=1 Tax=Nematostella vectensis TaxID=45351 RepID=UPI0020777DCD|nr:centrosomal protein of 63 kDa isoform X2 [Nematostella vectensis]